MWNAVKRKSRSLWVALKFKSKTEILEVEATPPIQITVIPAADKNNANETQRNVGSNHLQNPSTFFSTHLRNMYFLGASPVDLDFHSEKPKNWARFHKVVFAALGSASVLQALGDAKYHAVQIALGGTLRDVVDLGYKLLRVVFRGSIVLQLSMSGDDVKKLSQNVDLLANEIMAEVGVKQIKWFERAVMGFCVLIPALSDLYDLGKRDWNIWKFLEIKSIPAFYDALVWSSKDDAAYRQNFFPDVSFWAKVAGGMFYTVYSNAAWFHEYAAKYIMIRATLTLQRMATSFRSELVKVNTNMISDPENHDVGLVPGKVWDKYSRTKRASESINGRFGKIFNVIHLLHLMQCAYLLHTLLTNPKKTGVPFDLITILIAIVVHIIMAETSDVSEEFRNWIHIYYEPFATLKVTGGSNQRITMCHLLDQLGSNKIGIQGGAGVVTWSFNIVCASMAIQYFMMLWQVPEKGHIPVCQEFNGTLTA